VVVLVSGTVVVVTVVVVVVGQAAQQLAWSSTVPPAPSQTSMDGAILQIAPGRSQATKAGFPQIERAAQRTIAPRHRRGIVPSAASWRSARATQRTCWP
jgi:hypothetical protein